MYSKKDIEKNLIEYNYFIDSVTLANFIKNWKIDAIYEDEDGVEFYDNLAIAKLKKGISLKSQGYSNEQIIFHINKLLPEKLDEERKIPTKKELPAQINKTDLKEVITTGTSELKNLTVDVTNQTLQVLADAIAGKVSDEIKDSIKDADFLKQLLDDTTLREDNKELARKVEELTEDNIKLSQRIKELELEKENASRGFFTRLFK
ncbi:MAG: hypothetical protein MJ229_07785 [bacterium]|nr:hypothetical protein [bacterium]